MQLWARKSLDALQAEADEAAATGPRLRRSLGIWNLSSLGIGCTIGAGMDSGNCGASSICLRPPSSWHRRWS